MRLGTARCEGPGNSEGGHLVVLGQQLTKVNIGGLGVDGLSLLEDGGWEDIALLD